MIFNNTHRFTKQFDEIPQADIAACPLIESGESPEAIFVRADVPMSIRRVVRDLPYQSYTNTWLYVRPQRCVVGEHDHRSGTFFHVDVDSVYRAVAPSWEPADWRVMIVSFGDVAETEFVSEPYEMTPDGPPRVSDYVTFSSIFRGAVATESPKPGQVTEYSIRDFHRASPNIRRNAWRLAIVCFETNAPPCWPPKEQR